MDIWSSFSGLMYLRITTADQERLLNDAMEAGIELYDIHCGNDLTVSGKIDRRNYKRLKALLQRRGDKIESVRRFGIYWKGKQIRFRPVFVLTFLLLLQLALFLPSRVLFIRVEGNQRLPEKLILEYAENCGIRFGASRSEVRSEQMKNQLLSSIPELQWAGINTKGCTAVISVREKEVVDEMDRKTGVSSIVAVHDGVIEQCTVIRGNGLCKVGDAVKAGQVLVSGYTDCGISIQATRADAEIFAKTLRKLDVFCLADGAARTEPIEELRKYSLIIGKKQIKFYKDSGISDVSCVKMREELCLTLPGGFKLPVTFVTERIIPCDTKEHSSSDFSWAAEFAREYLQKEMLAGSILSEECSAQHDNGKFVHSGVYSCYEMIGTQKDEEIIS